MIVNAHDFAILKKMCALILNSVAHLLPAVSIDELIFALYEREINSLLKAKASIPCQDPICTSTSGYTKHPDQMAAAGSLSAPGRSLQAPAGPGEIQAQPYQKYPVLIEEMFEKSNILFCIMRAWTGGSDSRPVPRVEKDKTEEAKEETYEFLEADS